MIKIKAIQENPKVGDIEGNTELLTRHLESAKAEGVNLLVFSEMFLSGYPPEDLVMREDFLYEMKRSIDSIIPKTKEISLIFGAPVREDNRLYNAAIFVQDGKFVDSYFKQILPNYKEFDEKDILKKAQKTKFYQLMGFLLGSLFAKTFGQKIL